MTIEQGPSGLDKVFYFVLGTIMVAFVISIPFMARDQQRRLEQRWHDEGCQMYDDEKAGDIPAKCSQYFIDHYRSQPLRTQPPQGGR